MIGFYEFKSKHIGLVIFDVIFYSLLEREIKDQVFTITLDNASNNDVVVRNLKSNFQLKSKLHFKGKFNLMVQYTLKKIKGFIHNIRESVKYLEMLPIRLYKFDEIARYLNIFTKTKKGCAH